MKTYNQFLETPFSEEVKPPEPPSEEEDPSIKSKQKRQMQIKKMVLLKKLQAVRAGSGADIVASHTPEGEMVEDKAFDFVKKKIEKEVGKSGYVSKDNPRKPPTAAQKKAAAAHQAKVDAENAAERAKDPSQGRYPKG